MLRRIRCMTPSARLVDSRPSKSLCISGVRRDDSPSRDDQPHATLADGEHLFERYEFNCLPVHSGEALLGVLTKLDVVRALLVPAAADVPSYEAIMGQEVQSVMTRDPVRVHPDTPLTRVLQIMVETRYKSLPVMIGALLIGMISRQDVIRAVRRAAMDQGPEPVHYWCAKPTADTGDMGVPYV